MWSLGLGLGMEASPENFFSSKFSRAHWVFLWKKKNIEAHKVLGNPGKTIVFEVIGVKSEFWLKDLDDILHWICTQNKKNMPWTFILGLVKNEKL